MCRRRLRIRKITFAYITNDHPCANFTWMSGLWRLTLRQSAVGTTPELWHHTKQLYSSQHRNFSHHWYPLPSRVKTRVYAFLHSGPRFGFEWQLSSIYRREWKIRCWIIYEHWEEWKIWSTRCYVPPKFESLGTLFTHKCLTLNKLTSSNVAIVKNGVTWPPGLLAAPTSPLSGLPLGALPNMISSLVISRHYSEHKQDISAPSIFVYLAKRGLYKSRYPC